MKIILLLVALFAFPVQAQVYSDVPMVRASGLYFGCPHRFGPGCDTWKDSTSELESSYCLAGERLIRIPNDPFMSSECRVPAVPVMWVRSPNLLLNCNNYVGVCQRGFRVEASGCISGELLISGECRYPVSALKVRLAVLMFWMMEQ